MRTYYKTSQNSALQLCENRHYVCIKIMLKQNEKYIKIYVREKFQQTYVKVHTIYQNPLEF